MRNALARNNANAGGGVLPQHAEQYLIRSVGLIQSLDDIRNIVLKESGATPIYMRDVADVRLGTEVRYGAMMKNGYTEAVGGVVLMTSGGNAKADREPREGACGGDQQRSTCCRTAWRLCRTTTARSWWMRRSAR